MNKEDMILFLIIFIIICYALFKKNHFIILWNKYLVSISEAYVNKVEPIRLSLLSVKKWEYRGEGNEFIAISLPEEKKILRLRKAQCSLSFTEYINHIKKNILGKWKAGQFEKLNLEYYRILGFLIGDCYVCPAQEVLLISNEISKINKIISVKRPKNRKQKQIAYAYGSILTDYAYLPNDWNLAEFTGPTIAVEIKPKQGWIPYAEHNYNLCTYCLNQYIKLRNGEIRNISQYCPMDLFSGVKSRMKFAVKSLLNSPQNNLKIFQNGDLVYGENINCKLNVIFNNIFGLDFEKSLEEFCDLVSSVLLKQFVDYKHKCSDNKLKISNNTSKYINSKTKLCNFTSIELPNGCVLDKILRLQKLDVWGANKIYKLFNQQNDSFKQNLYGHANNIVTRVKNCATIISSCSDCFFRELNSASDQDFMIEKYLMSAIAKDCSIMVTFRKVTKTNSVIPSNNIIKCASDDYAFNIGVFDLYPKPLNSIIKHKKKRDKFNEIYKTILTGYKVPIS